MYAMVRKGIYMLHFNDHQNKLRKRLPVYVVLGLIGLAMVPYGWVAGYSSKASFIVYHVLGGAMTHVIGHFLLFALMGTAVTLIAPRLLKQPALYFGLMLLLGLLQEFLQLATFKQRPISFDDGFDIVVDLAGAVVAFWLLRKARQRNGWMVG